MLCEECVEVKELFFFFFFLRSLEPAVGGGKRRRMMSQGSQSPTSELLEVGF